MVCVHDREGGGGGGISIVVVEFDVMYELREYSVIACFSVCSKSSV